MPSRILLFALALAGCAATAAAQPALPKDFVHDVLVTNLARPTGFTTLPDGRHLIIEQRTAHVKVLAAGVVATIATIPNVRADTSERGLLGVEVDPKWPTRPYVYLYYTSSKSPTAHLIRMTATGDVANPTSTNLMLVSPYCIIDDIPSATQNHKGGTVRFGPGGMLFLSLGDDGTPCTAQSIDDLRGCILRLDVSKLPTTGTGPAPKSLLVPPENPFRGPSVNARLTFAYGLRNPFRFNVDPKTGRLYIADVGEALMEEFDEAEGGENFGWPWLEGTVAGPGCGPNPPKTTPPLATLLRTEGQSVIAFGLYRNRTGAPHNFGLAYEGCAFYGDFYTGLVRRLRHDGNGWIAAPQVPGQPTAADWCTGSPFVSQADIGADGALYLTNLVGGSMHRIRYVPRLPRFTSPTIATSGTRHALTLERDPGDLAIFYVALGADAPRPVERHFGMLELGERGFSFAGMRLDTHGRGTITLPPVPHELVGHTVHFQAVVVSGPDAFISPRHAVTIEYPRR